MAPAEFAKTKTWRRRDQIVLPGGVKFLKGQVELEESRADEEVELRNDDLDALVIARRRRRR